MKTGILNMPMPFILLVVTMATGLTYRLIIEYKVSQIAKKCHITVYELMQRYKKHDLDLVMYKQIKIFLKQIRNLLLVTVAAFVICCVMIIFRVF